MTAAAGDDVIHMVSGKLTEAQEMVHKLYDGVNQLLSWVPEAFMHLIEPIKKGMEEFGKLQLKVFEEIYEFIENRGNIGLLREMSEQWSGQVSAPLKSIAGALNLDKHRSNIEWEGRAAEAYKALVPGQAGTVTGVQGVADKMATALDALANAVRMFWVSIAFAVVLFAVGLAGAIAGLAGIATALPAVAGLAGVITVVLGLIGSAVTAFITTVQPIKSQVKVLQGALDGLGETWSKPGNGVDLSDGSASDGDASNWESR
ncbi:hypothetical protein [Saccharopolyspora gloriosae]|uniref:hypothetical protein n=1 Tax=Saccharopolyspora gloriosae TaxID=455344 RepID=UPI001FB7F38D|nr:hypothetical protein [Saccharopolyspora gloriosae]